ncbi:MAG: glutamate formimidoyltransferase [Clostridia bacterium]|nr:glutamate formimidoyltransferase [Clostridia bacterium]MBR0508380.1 glutamate formimidoyltransferase [Clostridia bacterium]
MAKLMECIPNISEGRRMDLVEEFADVVRAVPGVTLIDYSSDASHNRSVFTFLGDPDQVMEAAFRFAKLAVEKIDLRVHEGEHPRMGAVDVIPFVPIRDMDMQECVERSKVLAERIASELDLPVFLYEESASAPHRKNLAAIRKGQFEGMAEKVLEEQWHPDFGGNRIHPSAGVVAVGARQPLIAFNINLDTSDVSIAKKIAKIIREKDGGFRAVKALGVMLEERNIAQVSINMCDYKQTPLYRVLEFVRFEAARYGVHVVGTEIIGLAPMMAFVDAADYYLQIEKFDAFKQVLECHLL